MTQEQFDNHDCTKGLEDGCTCDFVEIDDDGGDDYGYDSIAQGDVPRM